MIDWRAQLRDDDHAVMSADRAHEIRQLVVAAAQRSSGPARHWSWKLALAGIALGIVAGHVGHRHDAPIVSETPAAIAPAERRQVQFSTPGGTRIIWELNPEFTLETLP